MEESVSASAVGGTATRIVTLTLILLLFSKAFAELPQWDFEQDSQPQQWVPNAHLSNVVVKDGKLRAEAVGRDPFLHCRGITIKTKPWQYVVIRMRANRPGIGEFFWSGELEGKYGGLTEKKKVRFSIKGEDYWQEIVVFPFWHTEGIIRQLRLDVFDDAYFEVDWIRLLEWGANQPRSGVHVWGFGGDTSQWQIHPEAAELFASPLRIDISDKSWVNVQLESDRKDVASILWACEKLHGLKTEEFRIRGDGKIHSYNIKMTRIPAWRDHIVAFGIRLPQEGNIRLQYIEIGKEPVGPGELEVDYFGSENGVNRAGRPCRLLAQVVNRDGSAQGIRGVHLLLPKGLQLVSEPDKLSHEGVEYGEFARFVWEVMAKKPGSYPVSLFFSGKGGIPPSQKTSLEFTEAPAVSKAKYVPEPKPVETSTEICGFYFPGWNSKDKWNCIRSIAPNRKPLLGYYDESNPECVDWQIKWAVENGVSCFLVDWYWVQGRQQLTHWFQAYRRAKYRDFLKVAIMWANHNPPNTHSVEDWLNVTRHWVESYFSLKSYYRIEGRPAVFIWNPKGIRSDLGGSEAVQRAFDQSQDMTRAAGYQGITFVAMGYDFSASHVKALLKEGYSGITTYHEWGGRIDASIPRKFFSYEAVVWDSPAAWAKKEKASEALKYYPLIDTGWDSRPWHGDKAMVIHRRTPALFEKLLQQAKTFCEDHDKPILILGPLNEWGEGSYIEPCTELGFEMLGAIRRVFGKGTSASWPLNISPSDVGLGPYDFPESRLSK